MRFLVAPLSVFLVHIPVLLASCARFSSGASCECDQNFWLDPRSEYCSVCPHTATCAGGSAVPVAKEGYYVTSSDPFAISVCPGKTTKCLAANVCISGYTGALCNDCADGYEQYGGASPSGEIQCEKCMAGIGCWHGLPVWTVALICTLVGLLEIWYVVWTLRRHKFLCFRDREDEEVRIIDAGEMQDLY